MSATYVVDVSLDARPVERSWWPCGSTSSNASPCACPPCPPPLDARRRHRYRRSSPRSSVSRRSGPTWPRSAPTPVLVVDLDVIATRYDKLRAALPDAEIFYAVKANPAAEILRLLIDRGASFDVASPGEIDLCLEVGVDPAAISYGNTIKKRSDIAYAFERGVRLFAYDSELELEKLAEVAPGADVFCRILTSNEGADWPLSRKFGCDLDMASDLLVMASKLQLNPVGVSFHVGSQQRNPGQWDAPLAQVAWLFDELAQHDLPLSLMGGRPLQAIYTYVVPTPSPAGQRITHSLRYHSGHRADTNNPSPGHPGHNTNIMAAVMWSGQGLQTCTRVSLTWAAAACRVRQQ